MDIIASSADAELLKTIAICLCPLLLSLCAWLIIRRVKEDADKSIRTWDKVVEIDKNLAVVLRDVEYIAHDHKMIWQRLDEFRAKLYES